ncbi:hypothetical protein PISMIDRAFT_689799 [Pisolithus microcarpus 441]|uniref:Uncharacterized protein n=1 Tax=Pisolithus microcarpus 441 TaxID=765257 RepID=A0A0C9YP55_9AGAM|nr:hypothetical protein PISMIDRAFT_689799 [Pisolithus microcarpus 441]
MPESFASSPFWCDLSHFTGICNEEEFYLACGTIELRGVEALELMHASCVILCRRKCWNLWSGIIRCRDRYGNENVALPSLHRYLDSEEL